MKRATNLALALIGPALVLTASCKKAGMGSVKEVPEASPEEEQTQDQTEAGQAVRGFSRADTVATMKPVVVASRLTPLDEGFPVNLPATPEIARTQVLTPKSAFEELDDIYGLMALAVVHADWQEGGVDPKRGHNVGGILVDGNFEVVNWSRNSNTALCNGTQHGEVSLMIKQMNKMSNGKTLKQFQIYTSLEPCMMCSGMMMQQELLRTVYMQTDDVFGKNIERLTLDSSATNISFDDSNTGRKGYKPAARPVISTMADSEFRIELDTAYSAVVKAAKARGSVASLTDFLRTPQALDIYKRARDKFMNYPLRFPNEIATAQFIVPASATTKRMPDGKFLTLTAKRTNKEVYEAAKAFFLDPNTSIIPLKADGTEDVTNIRTPRILEDPLTLIAAEGGPQPTAAEAEAIKPLVVNGVKNGKPFHQERLARKCK